MAQTGDQGHLQYVPLYNLPGRNLNFFILANGVVEVLNHKQTIDELVEEFYDKRVQVETEEELEESYKEGEENPFFDQALIDEAKTQKVKVTKKQPRGMKED